MHCKNVSFRLKTERSSSSFSFQIKRSAPHMKQSRSNNLINGVLSFIDFKFNQHRYEKITNTVIVIHNRLNTAYCANAHDGKQSYYNNDNPIDDSKVPILLCNTEIPPLSTFVTMTNTQFKTWLITKLCKENSDYICSFICVSLMETFQVALFKLVGNQGLYPRKPLSDYSDELLALVKQTDNYNNNTVRDDGIKKIEVIAPERAWILENVLSKEECEIIINVCEKYGFEISESYNFFYNGRHCDRIESKDKLLSNYIYNKIKRLIPNKNGFEKDGLNNLWRFCKYDASFVKNIDDIGSGCNENDERKEENIKGQKAEKDRNFELHRFEKHIDGGYLDTRVNGRKSYLTIMIYLNNGNNVDFKGGNTVFYDTSTSDSVNQEDLQVKYKVVPKQGMGIMFWQYEKDLLHSGQSVSNGIKYMMRTDIMFQLVDHRFCLNCTTQCQPRFHNHTLC